MKSGVCLLIVFTVFISAFTQVNAQVAPYSVSPKWMFGWGAGLDFTSGTPVVLPGNPSNSGNAPSIENSTSICEPSGDLAFYSNTTIIYNGVTNAVVHNLNTTDALAANSSTGGAVAFPDPASPGDQFYYFLANDRTAGLRSEKGIWYYKLTKTGTTVTVTSGPTQLTTGAEVDESIAACPDGQGNYYVVSHGRGTADFFTWKITSAGVSAVTKQVTSAGFNVTGTDNGNIKFSKCQDMIAWTGNSSLVVYAWNRTTGAIVSPASPIVKFVTGVNGLPHICYGLEFSPNGQYLYHSTLTIGAPELRQITISSGVVSSIDIGSSNAGTGIDEIGSMQLAPDGKIYVTNADRDGFTSTTYIGVINNPNGDGSGPGNCSYDDQGFTLEPGGASMPSIYRGLVNLAWLNPNLPVINNSIASCTVDFSILFQNYFLEDIDVDPTSVLWDFGDGSTSTTLNPSHSYATPGTYDVTLEFNDATCGHTYTAATQVTVTNCTVTPPPDCIYDLEAAIEPVTEVEIDDKNPVTVNFDGTSSVFDASTADAEKYFWINGSADTTLAFATTATTSLTFAHKGNGGNLPQGTYNIYLVIKEGDCMDTTKITLDVTYFFIPNLVTPNEDVLNDRFEITNTGGRFDVEIYNRWGDLVYLEKGYTKNWDLSKVTDGIYYYKVDDMRKGKHYKGWVQVVR